MTASEAIFNWNMVISLLFNCSLLGSSNMEVGKAGAAAAQPTQGYIDKDDILFRVAKSRKRASGAWSHKSCCGATFTSMIKYFWRSEMKKSKLLHKHPSYHQIFAQ